MKVPALLLGILIGVLAVGFVSMPSDQPTQKKDVPKTQVKSVYVCPMHPEVTSAKAGKCSECGMALVKKASTSAEHPKSKFVCPMHSEITSDKPGECSKCGMDLVKK